MECIVAVGDIRELDPDIVQEEPCCLVVEPENLEVHLSWFYGLLFWSSVFLLVT